MNTNLKDVTPETTHEEWFPGTIVRLFELPEPIKTENGQSRYVVNVSGLGAVGAGLAQEDTTPIAGFDSEPEIMFEGFDIDQALDAFLERYAPDLV